MSNTHGFNPATSPTIRSVHDLMVLDIDVPQGAVSFATREGETVFTHGSHASEDASFFTSLPLSKEQEQGLNKLNCLGTWGWDLNVLDHRGYQPVMNFKMLQDINQQHLVAIMFKAQLRCYFKDASQHICSDVLQSLRHDVHVHGEGVAKFSELPIIQIGVSSSGKTKYEVIETQDAENDTPGNLPSA